MKTTLVIMAAGLGTRFGQGIKQLESVGPSGELIMDYSVHDALLAGFDRVIFIIRRDIQTEFHERIGKNVSKIADMDYVFQELDDIPAGVDVPLERKKPWGTGQAVLCCRDLIDGPFAVINADDYYGRDPYFKLHDFLLKDLPSEEMCLVGFRLGNTLSDNGCVTRGICNVDKNGYLTKIDETKHIYNDPNGARFEKDGKEIILPNDTPVSMNMWGFGKGFMKTLEIGFEEFLSSSSNDMVSDEYLLPIYIDTLIKKGKARVKVLDTDAVWYGMTYKEDRETAINAFERLTNEGVYDKKLYRD